MALNKSRKYWEWRAENQIKAAEVSALQVEQRLKRAAASSIRTINAELDTFYRKYAINGNMTIRAATRLLNPKELVGFRENARSYLRLANEGNFTLKQKQELRQLSTKSAVSRLEELKMNISQTVEGLNKRLTDDLGTNMSNTYENSLYGTIYDANRHLGMGSVFTAPSTNQLNAILNEKWLGKNYSGRLWDNKNALIKEMSNLLTPEFLKGKGSTVVAQQLVDLFSSKYSSNIKLSDAQRLIRTEMNYIANKGTMDGYKLSGVVDEYVFVATLDNRTSDVCREQDTGEPIKLEDAKTGFNYPPLHPYCRSTTVAWFEEDVTGQVGERVARDKTGKLYTVDGDMNFSDWASAHADDAFIQRIKRQPKAVAHIDKTVPSEKPFNIHEYGVGYNTEELANYGEQAMTNLSTDEKKATSRYVATALSFELNRVLYTGNYESYKKGVSKNYDAGMGFGGISMAEKVRDIDNLSAIIKKHQLPHNMKLIRYVGTEGLSGMLSKLPTGISSDDFDYKGNTYAEMADKKSIVDTLNKNVAGATFTNTSFMSASYDKDNNQFKSKSIVVNVYTEKGVNGLVTNNHRESEVILDKGMNVEILGFGITPDRAGKIYIDLRIPKQ
jgi:SPP1 gp7 family putative phage head morphogenesis protein